MSAVPKKKLCWNCEGNVAKQIDNCPYCGVYLHPSEIEEDSTWNAGYPLPSSKREQIPSSFHEINHEGEVHAQEEPTSGEVSGSFAWNSLFWQFKRDIFPILFLMMGSLFFLFGVVLLLFSQNGMFTLQWQESHAVYFLLLAFPLIGFGWRFLQQLEETNH